ncbi:hypothetical protein [Sulfuricystis multivorans]|uniref:hypothetical protein n=1 Tax=Sulfuricystis multivorans TaxID=2211108 RepID=UPI000F82CBC2|nr:hypothetical protein [Sulfuricystis multivorans]
MRVFIKRIVVLGLLGLGVLGSTGASAHGGEDHGDEAKAPAPTVAIAPRASAQSEDFELVAVLEEAKPEGRRLRLFLDRFATNEPILGAKLEVDAGGQSALAQETSPGVYVAPFGVPANGAPGTKLPLTISIEAGDVTDLLTTTLEIPVPPDGVAAHVHGWGEIVTWLTAAVMGLTAVALLIVRRRRQTKGVK